MRILVINLHSNMSFGKLNILQHKTWNVWNRDAIEKVLKDEAALAEKQGKERAHQISVESERRTELLRNRKRDGQDTKLISEPAIGNKSTEVTVLTQNLTEYKGFSLFEGTHTDEKAEVNPTATTSGRNKEFEAEKRKEKEKDERKMGLVEVGRDSLTGESHAQKPWYAVEQNPSACSYAGAGQALAAHGTVPFGVPNDPESRKRREERRRRADDPATDMEKYLQAKKKSKTDGHRHGGTGASATDEEDRRRKMEAMRAERLVREAAERRRVEEIMGGGARLACGGGSGVEGASRVRERTRDDDPRSGYNSGFAQFHGGAIRRR